MIKVVRVLLVVAVALLAGFVGLAMLFGDLGPGESPASRAALVGGLHLVAGLAIGFVEPEHWQLAALAAWGATVMGLAALLGNLGGEIGQLLSGLILFFPLGFALAGGYAGRRLRQ